MQLEVESRVRDKGWGRGLRSGQPPEPRIQGQGLSRGPEAPARVGVGGRKVWQGVGQVKGKGLGFKLSARCERVRGA